MKVLIADDVPVSRRILEATLAKWGYEVVTCSNGNEAWDLLRSQDAPLLAILDWQMPGLDGVEICRNVRQRQGAPYTYILMLTGKNQKEDFIQALEAGADDYVSKPCDMEELRVRLRTGLRILDLQATLLATQEALRIRATHDSLTGLLNRAAISEILHRELLRAERDQKSMSLIMADLDFFKAVNDTYGHSAGDAALFAAASRIRSSVRPYDSVSRYGGEEFLLVLPGCAATDAANLAERIRKNVCATPVTFNQETIEISASLGVASSEEGQRASASALAEAADTALYRAKRNGRNRVETATWEDVVDHGSDYVPAASFAAAGVRR